MSSSTSSLAPVLADSTWPTNANYYQLPGGAISGNTGVTLTQFHYFKSCPAEVRNMIYKLLIISRKSIQIASPSSRPYHLNFHRRNFACIMLTDKETYAEVRGLYYTLNTFAVGNNVWHSSQLTNLHGLHEFMKFAPKIYLSQITNIEINVCANLEFHRTRKERFFDHDEVDGKNLMSVCRILLKHFRGLKHIVVKSCVMGLKPFPSCAPGESPAVQQGQWEIAGDALRLLLDGNRKGGRGLNGLGVVRFRWYESGSVEWSWNPDWNPGLSPSSLRPSFAGYVEEGRRELLNDKGEWEPLLINDDTMNEYYDEKAGRTTPGILLFHKPQLIAVSSVIRKAISTPHPYLDIAKTT
ncbi:hypothetical protein VTL71DRAFT_7451 [Oculimacula yallundae]|uniref:Uncharacterized protein n=1 Tax=Oculimacula yallundae TaxID=86028 RepID=A0ABR4BWR9_9HELO